MITRAAAVLLAVLALPGPVPARAAATPARAATEAPARRAPALDETRATAFAKLSLACVDQEYPNKTGHIDESATGPKSPRGLHPIFFGCFDWHSAAHAHWALARVLAQFPQSPVRQEIEAKFDAHFKPELVAKELEYFTQGINANNYERPYGYGWFLRLMQELRKLDHPKAAAWVKALEPLEKQLADHTIKFLAKFDFPIRRGVHENTSFALVHAYDYAKTAGNTALLQAITAKSRQFYLKDRDCPIQYEPSGDDFVSSCMSEAELMARVLDPAEFARWFKTFLPALQSKAAKNFLTPFRPTDLTDLKTVHLVGLTFQKAWSMKRVAAALPLKGPLAATRSLLLNSAQAHSKLGAELTFDTPYGGTHWLASFALFELTGAGMP